MTSKIWFITGGSRGFGHIWTQAAPARGDKVAATVRNTDSPTDLMDTLGDASLPLTLDVTDRAAAFAAVATAHERFGELDVIVNNAGFGLFGAIEETSEAEARVIGDNIRREVTATRDQIVADHLARFTGRQAKHGGDGVLATFDGPARAVRCALGIVDAAERLGLDVRVGVHTGECEVHDAEIGGVAIDIATRVAEHAAAGEILVSSTVRDLVAGSGIRFGEPRTVELDAVVGRRDVLLSSEPRCQRMSRVPWNLGGGPVMFRLLRSHLGRRV